MSKRLTIKEVASSTSEAIDVIDKCLLRIVERLQAVEKYLNELPTPDKVYYQPEGYEDYLNIKGNYDEIYRRISELEKVAHKAPTTDHGKRLTTLEEKIDGMQSLG